MVAVQGWSYLHMLLLLLLVLVLVLLQLATLDSYPLTCLFSYPTSQVVSRSLVYVY